MRHDLHLFRYRLLYWLDVAFGVVVGLSFIPIIAYLIWDDKRVQKSLRAEETRQEPDAKGVLQVSPCTVEDSARSWLRSRFDLILSLGRFWRFLGHLGVFLVALGLSVYIGPLLAALAATATVRAGGKVPMWIR